MKNKMNLLAIMGLSLVLTTACQKNDNGGGGGGGTASAQSEKSIFSKWTITNSNLTLDFTSDQFGANSNTVTYKTGEICACTFTFTGNQLAGTLAISNCVYVPSSGSGADPGCSSLNDSPSSGPEVYTIANSILTACPTTTTSQTQCLTFQ